MQPARRSSFTVEQAIGNAPVLARLNERIAEATARLEIIRPLLPESIRPCVTSGPIDERGWRLLAEHSAAAAKLKQLRPLLARALEDARLPVAAIEIKVQKGQPTT